MSRVLKGVEGAMRGYRPQVDWGGEEGSATIKVGSHNVKVGTAGWRRRCLFTLLSALLLLSILNFVLTLWLLRKISFNAEGAGSLRVLSRAMKLDGIFRLDHGLTVSKIRGEPSEDLNISGYHNISFANVENDEIFGFGLVLDSSGVRAATKGIRLKDKSGTLLFDCKERNTSTGAKFFTVTGDEGAIFYGPLQTPRIQGNDVHEFRIESRTRSVTSSAANLLRIEARDGDVTVTSLSDVSLTSSKGKFRFESPNVSVPNLFAVGEESPKSPFPVTTQATDTQIPGPDLVSFRGKISPENDRLSATSPGKREQKKKKERVQIFQVCVCPSGRLFLVAAESVCIPDELTCR